MSELIFRHNYGLSFFHQVFQGQLLKVSSYVEWNWILDSRTVQTLEFLFLKLRAFETNGSLCQSYLLFFRSLPYAPHWHKIWHFRWASWRLYHIIFFSDGHKPSIVRQWHLLCKINFHCCDFRNWLEFWSEVEVCPLAISLCSIILLDVCENLLYQKQNWREIIKNYWRNSHLFWKRDSGISFFKVQVWAL